MAPHSTICTSLLIFSFAQVHVKYNSLSFNYIWWPLTQCSLTIFASTYTLHTPSAPKMSTPKTIKQLVKDITTLSSSLSDAVLKGSKDDKIWSIMNTKEGGILHETFNCQFDALFGEDCHDSGGHLHYVCQGKLGMGLIMSYLSKINWIKDFPLDLMELKLQHLVNELKHIQWVPKWLFAICIDKLLDEWMYLAQHKLSTPQWSSRTLLTPRHLNFLSSTKLSRISTPDKPTRMTLILYLQQ